MARSTNAGVCALCEQRASKAQMPSHLATCIPKHEATGVLRTLALLRFDATHDSRYWVHVEARMEAPMRRLDAFLRALWLECCGHMSAFYVARREVGMGIPVAKAFAAATTIEYEYDFGSTTALTGTLVSTRSGQGGRSAVRLLARNEPISWSCAGCAAPATVLCPFCIDDDAHLFCDAHAGKHEHAREEVYLPVVNSPRMGVCGYTGSPA